MLFLAPNNKSDEYFAANYIFTEVAMGDTVRTQPNVKDGAF